MQPATVKSQTLTTASAGFTLPSDDARLPLRQELCPTGRLRFGVVVAPEATSFFVDVDAAGLPRGVTVELAKNLACTLGVPVDFVVVPNSGQLVQRLGDSSIDAAFMPVDDERCSLVDFGPAYTSAENTYLVRAGAGIGSLADIDRVGVKVIGIAGTTTLRSAAGFLKNAKIEPMESVGDALHGLRRGTADALALTRDSIVKLLPQVPGGAVLDETFRKVSIAIAVGKGQKKALACVTKWLEGAKGDGLVRQMLDSAGLQDVPVAG